MLDGCMYGTERTVFKTEDIFNNCKFELGTEIQWANTNTLGEILVNRGQGTEKWTTGKVVADYQTYIILENPNGYRYCLDKVDIATKRVVIKGFKPKIKKVFAVDYRL